ncbi:Cys-Gln thioester bond-forming surface protein, partial [Corynebacterium sp. ACRQP]|uniref:Cys-Gln thioester bond-forming surface protein n=1 Tax=Corynebacterium sp. ACRQP TaxID=2918195 RepID=UPI001EF701CB|nr:Cys-Gln thioester bond-forming surface protein [Corynebacterium sp. ACRQP]
MLDSPARTKSWWGVFVSLLASVALAVAVVAVPTPAQAQGQPSGGNEPTKTLEFHQAFGHTYNAVGSDGLPRPITSVNMLRLDTLSVDGQWYLALCIDADTDITEYSPGDVVSWDSYLNSNSAKSVFGPSSGLSREEKIERLGKIRWIVENGYPTKPVEISGVDPQTLERANLAATQLAISHFSNGYTPQFDDDDDFDDIEVVTKRIYDQLIENAVALSEPVGAENRTGQIFRTRSADHQDLVIIQPAPKLRTTASFKDDSFTDSDRVLENQPAPKTVYDRVFISDILRDDQREGRGRATYTLSATLVDKANPATELGSGSVTFKPSDPGVFSQTDINPTIAFEDSDHAAVSGYVTVPITLNEDVSNVESMVVFEELTSTNVNHKLQFTDGNTDVKTIGWHRDLEDSSQTLRLGEAPSHEPSPTTKPAVPEESSEESEPSTALTTAPSVTEVTTTVTPTVTVTAPTTTSTKPGTVVTTTLPNVTSTQPGNTVVTTQPDVTSTQPGNTVVTTQPDVTSTQPGNTVVTTQPDVTSTQPG